MWKNPSAKGGNVLCIGRDKILTMGCKSGSCQVARTSDCQCPCMGTGHGLGRIKWIDYYSQHRSLSPEAKKIRSSATKNINKLKPPKRHRVLASSLATDLLQEHMRSIEVVDKLISLSYGDRKVVINLRHAFEDAAADIVDNGISGGLKLTEPQKIRLSDHFWCDLAASIAKLIDQSQEFLKNLQQQAIKLLVKDLLQEIQNSRDESYGNGVGTREKNRILQTRSYYDQQAGLSAKLIGMILEAFLTKLFDNLTSSVNDQVEQWKLYFQILAILLCKDPQRHPLVWNYCLAPLVGQLAGQAVKNQAKNIIGSLANKGYRFSKLDVWDKTGAQKIKDSSITYIV